MNELLKILEEYTKKLAKERKEIWAMKMRERNDNNFWFCQVYDNGGAELIEGLDRFFSVFFAQAEIKGLKIYRGLYAAKILKEARRIRKEIVNRCNKEKEQKKEEDRDKSPWKPRNIWVEKRIERVFNFYDWTACTFEDWNRYPFGLPSRFDLWNVFFKILSFLSILLSWIYLLFNILKSLFCKTWS